MTYHTSTALRHTLITRYVRYICAICDVITRLLHHNSYDIPYRYVVPYLCHIRAILAIRVPYLTSSRTYDVIVNDRRARLHRKSLPKNRLSSRAKVYRLQPLNIQHFTNTNPSAFSRLIHKRTTEQQNCIDQTYHKIGKAEQASWKIRIS